MISGARFCLGPRLQTFSGLLPELGFDRPNLSLMCTPCPELPLVERNIAGNVCLELSEIAELAGRATGHAFTTEAPGARLTGLA
jgi:hypothetical protein